MQIELLRIPHSKTAGHDLVLIWEPSSGYRLATVMVEQGIDRILHLVHLRPAELAPLAKALIDALASGG